MQHRLTSQSQLPPKQKFASTFGFLGQISYWVHLLLGFASGITLLLVFFSRSFSEQSNNPAIAIVLFFSVAALLVLGFRIYWAWSCTRLARSLQAENPRLHPKRKEIINVLRIGLLVSILGLSLGFISTEVTVVAILAKAIAQPQGVAVYQPEKIVRSMDLFLILANVNIMGAHFLGGMNSLGLLDWITRE
ncbi:MAG: hypothetical protein Kow0049_03180 [Stanieria sp.]